MHGELGHVVVNWTFTFAPTLPAWAAGAVTVGLATTVQVNATVLVVLPSLTLTETLDVPVAVGVPVTAPVDDRVSPAGRVRGESLHV